MEVEERQQVCSKSAFKFCQGGHVHVLQAGIRRRKKKEKKEEENLQGSGLHYGCTSGGVY